MKGVGESSPSQISRERGQGTHTRCLFWKITKPALVTKVLCWFLKVLGRPSQDFRFQSDGNLIRGKERELLKVFGGPSDRAAVYTAST